jgi:signal transduction histidine kinase
LQGIIEMTGAVCHEPNQPMQAIYGYSQLVMMDMSEDNPLYADVNEIKVQIDRMADGGSGLGEGLGHYWMELNTLSAGDSRLQATMAPRYAERERMVPRVS